MQATLLPSLAQLGVLSRGPWLAVTWHDGVRVEVNQPQLGKPAQLAALTSTAVGQSQLQKDSR